MKAIKLILLLLCCTFLGKVRAQEHDLIFTIQNYIQQGDILNAKQASDSSLKISNLKINPRTWYLRGFAYKEYYKKFEAPSKTIVSREEAYRSFVRAVLLSDIDTSLLGECKKNLRSLSVSYYNDVKSFVDSNNYKMVIKYYDLFKRTATAADSSANFEQRDVQVNLALGSIYLKLAESADSVERKQYLQLEKEAFLKVLSIDPNNITANYNMALLYYNQAVRIINSMGYDEDIVRLIDIQDNTTHLFIESRPFMEKADSINPYRRETLIGLSGIYFSLNEEEKYREVEKRIQDLDRNKK
jgi:tetratricopeptide (TPR) repeat protein